MKKVGVVVLNYKVAQETIDCVKSVLKNDYGNLKIYVVDNNSGDGIEESIKDFKQVEFIQTGDNLGFAGGNNIGIKKALKDGCDLAFIVNPDTTLEKDTISILLSGMEDQEAGIVGPKILFETEKNIWFAGGKLDKNNVMGSHIGVDEKDIGQYDEIKEVDFITGAGMMISREVIEKVGVFDERYFLYLEDVDLCFRAKEKGFKIRYIPTAKMYHQNAKSTGLGSPLQDYFITRNRMLFAKKFLPLRTQLALLREAMRNFKKPVRRQAFLDFLSGNFGKGSFIK
jgi:GT2 family glycosyltransferase